MLFGLVASIAGCAAPREPSLGTVTANLVGQAPSGAVYRLRHAVITVTGPGTTRIWNTEDDPDRTSLSDDVPIGNYSASLAAGWDLERIEGASATPVTAQLVSDNPVDFLVSPDQRTSVPLRFHVDTDEVDLSQGYDLVLTVDESTPQIIVVANINNFQSGSITVYPGNASGDVAPLRTIAGPLTTLSSPEGIAVTDDEIVVCDGGIGAVDFFPINADGNVAPTRQIVGRETEIGACIDVAVYQGEVYVIGIDELLVFPITANGDAAPSRRISGFFFGQALAIDRGELYVADEGGQVFVYALPVADDAEPVRDISVDCPFGIAAGEGELFVNNACATFGEIDVFAEDATGRPPALRMLRGDHTGLQAPAQIKRFQDELYVSDIDADQILIYPVTASGDVPPARSIGGPHTGVFTPLGVAVH
ncbi:MAG TPA: hypothetical protein VHW23_18040 [Kofleriaceae bacterium]|nr:hypothetical protein [Kofleriaceae bacterium]